MKKLRVDEGAIKFVLAGANIMCPGLTSEGATIHDEVRSHQPHQLCSQHHMPHPFYMFMFVQRDHLHFQAPNLRRFSYAAITFMKDDNCSME
jgi:hypothetical protein